MHVLSIFEERVSTTFISTSDSCEDESNRLGTDVVEQGLSGVCCGNAGMISYPFLLLLLRYCLLENAPSTSAIFRRHNKDEALGRGCGSLMVAAFSKCELSE
jgi:hypothetical protein